MAPFLSFEKLLIKYLRLIKPELVLEWGTGNSTRIMLEECPKAEIHTIEHDLNWFVKWYGTFKDRKNVYAYCIPLTENYYLAPLSFLQKGKFDLVFIDGRQRVKCIQVAKTVICDEGVVILHDSERERYSSGKALFRIIEESDGTAVMTHS